MKFFIAFALFAVVAAKPSFRGEQAEIDEIIAAINSPNTDPATASALEQLLQHIVGIFNPISIGPAIVDGYEPISVGPAIVDAYEPISVGPAIVDAYEPISVGPAIVDFPIPESALAPTPAAGSPLVQIIVNVKQPQGGSPGGSPVTVEGIDSHIIPTPVAVIEDAFVPETIIPSPEPVIAAPEPVVVPEPVIVAPVIVAPAIVAPEILN